MYSSNPTFIWLKMDEDCEIADLHGSVDSNEARSRYASIKRTHWQSGIVGDNSILVEALQQTPRCEAELKILCMILRCSIQNKNPSFMDAPAPISEMLWIAAPRQCFFLCTSLRIQWVLVVVTRRTPAKPALKIQALGPWSRPSQS